MLKAKLDRIRKNKKGFSLVELIIVIAIMVALIAVMAPNFVKYVQKSRDTALQTAAEDYLSAVKVAYGDPDTTLTAPASGSTITIKLVLSADGKSNNINITASGISADDLEKIATSAGVDTGKAMGKSLDVYTITFGADATCTMSKGTQAAIAAAG